jgi:TatD DNase family protein
MFKFNKENYMFIDTHCHINIMVKKEFDTALNTEQIDRAQEIITQAAQHEVTTIINVGTSLIESGNCIELAKKYLHIFATIGIHPNDLTTDWQKELKTMREWIKKKDINKIVGIGETGLDRHYPDPHMQRQKDAFKAQIELALENNLGLVVHTRDARDETLRALEEFKGQITRGIIHCFSEDQSFADQAIEWGFVLGIGGTITYPKNLYLRDIVAKISLNDFVLETDAPFLPPQVIRGKQNNPMYIKMIAEYISQLRGESLELVGEQTSQNAKRVFGLNT